MSSHVPRLNFTGRHLCTRRHELSHGRIRASRSNGHALSCKRSETLSVSTLRGLADEPVASSLTPLACDAHFLSMHAYRFRMRTIEKVNLTHSHPSYAYDEGMRSGTGTGGCRLSASQMPRSLAYVWCECVTHDFS